MTGWFGVRGIGSLYYLMFAIQQGLPEPLALRLIELTLIVITLSILVHGISVKPLMGYFWRRGKPRITES
jgi:NhaP-type Na+/H+ or K+/H+ antiporter